MRTALRMWSSTGMIAQVAAVAAFYAVAQISLAPVSLVLIPGVLQFKAANIFTMLLGLLFGPAGAWGVAVGNTIGDFFTGSLALGSFFGFWSSFIVPFVGYVGWSLMLQRNDSWARRWSARKVVTLLLLVFVGATASAVILGWGLEALGIAPFQVISNVLVANFVIGGTIGVGLFYLVGERVRALRVTWLDVLPSEALVAPRTRALGLLLIAGGGVVGWVLGGVIGMAGAALLLSTGVCLAVIVAGALLS